MIQKGKNDHNDLSIYSIINEIFFLILILIPTSSSLYRNRTMSRLHLESTSACLPTLFLIYSILISYLANLFLGLLMGKRGKKSRMNNVHFFFSLSLSSNLICIFPSFPSLTSFLPLCMDHLRSHYRSLKNDVWSRGSIDSHFFFPSLRKKSLTTKATFPAYCSNTAAAAERAADGIFSFAIAFHRGKEERKGQMGSNLLAVIAKMSSSAFLPFFPIRGEENGSYRPKEVR